ncbi:MAG: hypothetical protein AUJ55_05475 [Proteobacteria bacterium CG1_02_64_396]|nr:MAG: hypothetical protein AUJ55_05475 [Proteobacteria bacterium CG1_02_64_396]
MHLVQWYAGELTATVRQKNGAAEDLTGADQVTFKAVGSNDTIGPLVCTIDPDQVGHKGGAAVPVTPALLDRTGTFKVIWGVTRGSDTVNGDFDDLVLSRPPMARFDYIRGNAPSFQIRVPGADFSAVASIELFLTADPTAIGAAHNGTIAYAAAKGKEWVDVALTAADTANAETRYGRIKYDGQYTDVMLWVGRSL